MHHRLGGLGAGFGEELVELGPPPGAGPPDRRRGSTPGPAHQPSLALGDQAIHQGPVSPGPHRGSTRGGQSPGDHIHHAGVQGRIMQCFGKFWQ